MILVDYQDVLDLEHVIGNLYSAIPESQLPSPDHPARRTIPAATGR